MLKFYYSGAPNPTKVALFLERPPTPNTLFRSTPARASTHRNFSRSIRMPSCRPSSTATSPYSIPALSCSISLEKPESFCRPKPTRRAANYCRGCSSCLRRRSVFRPGGALPRLRAGEAALCDQPLRVRRPAPRRHPRRAAWQAQYMLGDTYTIADMNVWGWVRDAAERGRRGRLG